jgi:FkbM family methyltransferase
MYKRLKDLLKKTPLYPLYQKRRFWKWTKEDEAEAAFYKQFISPGDLVFDVGANVGNRTKVFYELGARVVAFEPQVDCYRFLKMVFNGKSSVCVLNQALGKTRGQTEMLISDYHCISSLSTRWIEAVKGSGRFSDHKWEKTQPVEMTTLDESIQEFGVPSFIKIDVEGYESEILSGLSTPINCLSVEFTPEDAQNALGCIDHMSSLSVIDARLSLGESMKWETPSWLTAGKIKQAIADVDPKAVGDVYIRCLHE